MVMNKATEDYLGPAGMGTGREEEESTRVWAKEQYLRGLEKLNRLSPVTSLASIEQGDVMISASGNVRTVLKTDKRPNGSLVTFLSRLHSSKVTIESALQDKIDLSKLQALVRRKSGNPLEKFGEIAKNLESEHAVLQNIRILLQSGMLGGQLRSGISLLRRKGELFVDLDVWVAAETGEIQQIGGEYPRTPSRVVSLSINSIGTPSEEYIKSARFERGSEPLVKRNILAAAVIANTVENARNLMQMARIARL